MDEAESVGQRCDAARQQEGGDDPLGCLADLVNQGGQHDGAAQTEDFSGSRVGGIDDWPVARVAVSAPPEGVHLDQHLAGTANNDPECERVEPPRLM